MELLSLFGKSSNYLSEYKQFKKSLDRNPRDFGLKAQFIKFCLLNRFTKNEGNAEHITEALKLFEAIENSDIFDMQCHYLVGKYYQEAREARRAYKIYLKALNRFNQLVGKKPELKSENSELAYSVALNLMTLQSNPIDPQVEITFKIIRKSFPLHLKRIEYENEMAKPAPDPPRLKQLSAEIRQLKDEEEKEFPQEASPVQADEPESVKAPEPKTPEAPKIPSKGIYSKLFNQLSPDAVGLTGSGAANPSGSGTTSGKQDSEDFLKIAPSSPSPSTAFMAFRKDRWEGPFTLPQLQSMGFLEPATWVCRAGNQQVLQAYEVPDLQALFKH